MGISWVLITTYSTYNMCPHVKLTYLLLRNIIPHELQAALSQIEMVSDLKEFTRYYANYAGASLNLVMTLLQVFQGVPGINRTDTVGRGGLCLLLKTKNGSVVADLGVGRKRGEGGL